MKELTKAEEQVMQILWKHGSCFVKDMIDEFEEPKPAYNTVSTIVRILEKKGFVAHKAFGKTHQYYPLIDKKKYAGKFFKNVLKKYFNNSMQYLVSNFSEEEELSIEELEQIKTAAENIINQKKND